MFCNKTDGIQPIFYDIYEKDFLSLPLIIRQKDMFRRKILENLQKWKVSKGRKPLVLRGARQVGKTITLSNFAGSNYKSREVGEAFRTLEKTMLLELVYPTTSTSMPPIADVRRSPKLIWLDNGLVNYESKLRKEILSSKDILDVWRGKLAEQMVAQELLTLTTKVSERRNFWVRAKAGATAEVDFVYVSDSELLPIEVKAGNNAHLRSLHSFIDLSDVDVAIRVWSQPFSIDKVCTAVSKKPFTLVNVPFYLVGDLPEILQLVH